MRILFVEDDALIREFVVEALREEGYDVIHAANGAEALAWCDRKVADVLITRLPDGIDGWQIAEHCREHDPGLPVIYATGFSP
ncbi:MULTISPECIES: response regulator [unclassified Bradyrhizobium]|uniref:response regulator n=1 Tax=unclassified Bradyrhizobium TaxID=2631580 RepID=UPI001FFAAFB4|nr:response regulator [Bradyrhizobium sp. 48]MCK1461805.1 response regulator [Bradyrhizobium sp. 2]